MAGSTASDHDLLQSVKAGDEEAFTTLYRRRQGAVFRFALHMTGCRAIAEDVTQEVFMALMREVGRYDPEQGSLPAYLYGIARNQVLRRLDRERLYVPISDENDDAGEEQLATNADPLSDLTRSETIEAVRRAVLALPAHYREVAVLCDLHELSYVEAATLIGCAVGTVRSRLHRARGLLLEKLRSSESVAAGRCIA